MLEDDYLIGARTVDFGQLVKKVAEKDMAMLEQDPKANLSVEDHQNYFNKERWKPLAVYAWNRGIGRRNAQRGTKEVQVPSMSSVCNHDGHDPELLWNYQGLGLADGVHVAASYLWTKIWWIWGAIYLSSKYRKGNNIEQNSK